MTATSTSTSSSSCCCCSAAAAAPSARARGTRMRATARWTCDGVVCVSTPRPNFDIARRVSPRRDGAVDLRQSSAAATGSSSIRGCDGWFRARLPGLDPKATQSSPDVSATKPTVDRITRPRDPNRRSRDARSSPPARNAGGSKIRPRRRAARDPKGRSVRGVTRDPLRLPPASTHAEGGGARRRGDPRACAIDAAAVGRSSNETKSFWSGAPSSASTPGGDHTYI